MPVHPSPPSDVPSVIEAYRQVVSSFADLADGLREADWDAPTCVPGWTARDHLAHVVHIEDYLSGGDHPGGTVHHADDTGGRPDHVRNDFGAWNEEGVLARRGTDPAALVAELRGLADVRSAQMYAPDLTLETPVRSVMGEEAPFGVITRLRLSDIWVHEQDLREVVGRPGSLDTAGASQFVDHLMGSLPRTVLRRVRPEPGTVVILESTGPVTARAGVRVGTDAQGELVAHELFTGHTDGEDAHPIVPDGDAPDRTTTISLSTHELTRRGAGRRPTGRTAYQVVGDEDLARRVLDALAITP